MKTHLVFLYTIFLIIFSCVLSGCGNFDYDIDKFTVVGGPDADSTFVDNFDDDQEPPAGPSGLSTYNVTCPLSSDVETGGFLNLNRADACEDDGEAFIDVELDTEEFFISPTSGGSIEGKFRVSNGFIPNSEFGIEIFSSMNGVSIKIESSSTGKIYALFNEEGNEEDVIPSKEDITDLIEGITDITIKMDISSTGAVTGTLDFGSDGTFDLILAGSAILDETVLFTGGFTASQ